jgi:hypothetical protein
MRYSDENEVLGVIAKFEDATIAREAWTHKEHLVVALHYLNEHDFDKAYRRMRSAFSGF